MQEQLANIGPDPRPRYNGAVPSIAPEAFQGAPLMPQRDMNMWREYLKSAGISTDERPPLKNPISEALLRKKKSREKPGTPWRWMRSIWMRDWYKRRKERIQQDAAESRSGAVTFMTLSRMAINLAVNTEPNIDIRETKRRDLLSRWRKFGRELFTVVRS